MPKTHFYLVHPVLEAVLTREGYSATKHDESVAKIPNPMRRQFGHSYDVKKVRNSWCATMKQKPNMPKRWFIWP
jgi:hypothetical protein